MTSGSDGSGVAAWGIGGRAQQTNTGLRLAHYLLLASVLCGVLLSSTRVAHAYEIHTAISDGCHEMITFDALRRFRDENGLEAKFFMSRGEKTLIRDSPFTVPSDLDDLGAFTLALANRSVDLKGNEPDDLDKITKIHGNPENQPEHCLRRPRDIGESGAAQALDACRSTIMAGVDAAIATLDTNGSIDPSDRTELDAFIEFQSSLEVELPSFHVEMGKALHTLQDSFTHQLRGDGHSEVHTVLNYAEYAEGSINEAEDGPPHSPEMDKCKGLDDLRRARLSTATTASYELLTAVLATEGSADDRRQAASAVLDNYLTIKEGCTLDNRWCDAEDAQYPPEPAAGCTVAATRATGVLFPPLFTAMSAALALFFFRRHVGGKHSAVRFSRVQRSPHRGRARLRNFSAMLLALLVLRPGLANAQSEPAANAAEAQAWSDEAIQPEKNPWGVYIAASGALQNPAVAATLGARYRIGENFLLGLNGEFNPIFSTNSGEARLGMANAYASFIFRMPTGNEHLALRTSLHLGTSTLLFDVYGANSGSTGIFAGINILGLDYEVAKQLYIVFDPANIAITAPHLRVAPFVYPQYRVTIGLQWGS